MLSQTTPITASQHQEQLSLPAEAQHDSYVPTYNEADYSDFLYLAPPLSAGFLLLEPEAGEKRPLLISKKAKTQPAGSLNTGTTPPIVALAEGHSSGQKEYFRATFPPVLESPPVRKDPQPKADRTDRQRRPGFVEVTPAKAHHEKDIQKDAKKERRLSDSSHDSEPMDWWPENAARANHQWVEQDDGKDDGIEGDMWSDRFYE